MQIEATLEDMRADGEYGDWREVFNYASPEKVQAGAVVGEAVSTDSFGMDDVAEVLGSVNGENDESDWVAVLHLKDGRFACLRAGCDYTGWG